VLMRNLNEKLEQLNTLIETYHGTPSSDGTTLVSLAQEISAVLYYLSEEKSKEHDNWQRCVNYKVKDLKMNVNRAENDAHVAFPMLYRLRYVIRAGYSVLDIIRTQVSYLKSEMNNLK
jgi:hypothetical protein